MLGQLPRALDVNGVRREIRADYINILRTFDALNADELTEQEKNYVFLLRMYKDFRAIPPEDYQAAQEAAVRFIECNTQDDKPGPRLVDWRKDEQIVFPAINAAAGREVRDCPEMHWWTFLGYFQNIDPESLCGMVMCIRSKRAKHRKLEKHEQAFYNANRALCELYTPDERKKKTDNDVLRWQRELLAEQAEQEKGGD